MNAQTVLAFLEKYGVTAVQSALTLAIDFYRTMNPAATTADIVAYVDGSFKHEVRVKLGPFGWGVDIIWPELEPALDALIAETVSITAPAPTLDTDGNPVA